MRSRPRILSSLVAVLVLVFAVGVPEAKADDGDEGRTLLVGVAGVGAFSSVAVTGGANPFDRKLGVGGGVQVSSEIVGDLLEAHLGVIYAPRGMTASVSSPFAEVEEDQEVPTSTLITDYSVLQIPVVAGLRFLRQEQWALFATAGPTASIFLGRRNRTTDTGWRRPASDDEVRRLTLGIAAGVGADFDLGFGRMTLEARFDRDLVPLIRTVEGTSERFYHTAVGLHVGLALPILEW